MGLSEDKVASKMSVSVSQMSRANGPFCANHKIIFDNLNPLLDLRRNWKSMITKL